MARHLFGSIADFVVAPGDSVTVGSITGNQTLLVPSAVVSFWSAASGGTQYSDLLDLSSSSITAVTSDSNGALPQFYGPDGITLMFADAGGDRRAVVAVDSGADIAANAAAVAAVSATVSGLAAVATSGQYADLGGTPTLAPVAASGSYTDLINTPPPGLQYVQKIGGSWPLRSTTAPDSARVARWIGPSPAPPAGSGYALAGDLWDATPA